MKNKYEVNGDETVIYMLNRKGESFKTLIDTEDLSKVIGLKTSWIAHEDHGKRTFYAETVKTKNKKREHIGLHRLVMNCPSGLVVDHINHNTLDNRKSNLRIVNQSGNQLNRKGANKQSSSGIRGVSWHKNSGKWQACLRINGERVYLGLYKDKKEAEKTIEDKLEKVVTE